MEKGAPSQKTCRSPRSRTPRGRRIRASSFSHRPRGRCRRTRRCCAALSHRSAAPPAFPTTVHAANGDIVIKSRPVRVVSLSPSATEDLFAVGAGAQVIAVDDQSDYPKQAPHTNLSGFQPEHRGDRLVQPRSGRRSRTTAVSRRRSRSSASPCCSSRPRHGRAGVRRDQPDRRRRPATRQPRPRSSAAMQRKLTALIRSVPKRSRHLKVFHELSPDFYSATSSTFIGRIYRLFGFRNIADAADTSHSGYPQLSAEYIVACEPRHRRARRLRLLRADGRDRRRAAGLAAASRRCATSASSRSTTASRRAGGRASSTSRASSRQSPGGRDRGAAPGARTPRAFVPAASRPPGRCALARVPARLAPRRPRRRRRRHRAWRDRRVGALAPAAAARPLVARRASRTRSSGSCARRASSSPRSSAACSRSRARRTRASSGTRSPTRTCSASRPAPGSARRS